MPGWRFRVLARSNLHAPNVRVLMQPALQLASVAHRGAYINIGQAFERVFTQVQKQGLTHPGLRMLGVYFDDPAMVSTSALRSCAAVVLAPGASAGAPARAAAGAGR